MLDDIQPELKITPRFAKKSAKEGWDWSIRCPAGQFTMNMHSPPGSQRSYAHLAEEFQKWFPRWQQHFGVTRVQKCEMVYLNELSAATLPAFTTKEGALEIAKVLTVFTHIPGEHEHLVPPFDCRATVLLREPAGATLSIQLSDWNTEAGKPKLLLQLRVSQEWGHDSPAMEKVAEWLDVCHRRIIERFEVLFTPEARQSFEPILPKS